MEYLSPFNWECWTEQYLSAEESWRNTTSVMEDVYPLGVLNHTIFVFRGDLKKHNLIYGSCILVTPLIGSATHVYISIWSG